jgi:hypothetical protein
MLWPYFAAIFAYNLFPQKLAFFFKSSAKFIFLNWSQNWQFFTDLSAKTIYLCTHIITMIQVSVHSVVYFKNYILDYSYHRLYILVHISSYWSPYWYFGIDADFVICDFWRAKNYRTYLRIQAFACCIQSSLPLLLSSKFSSLRSVYTNSEIVSVLSYVHISYETNFIVRDKN